MSDFLDINFPEEIAYGSVGAVSYSTFVQRSISGVEQRNINWQYGKHSYTLNPAIKSKDDLDKITALFHTAQGQGYSFRFKDYADFSALNSNIGIGDGINKIFQLKKTYSFQGVEKQRIITKPKANSVNIYIDAVLQNTNTYSTNYLSGEITFNTAPLNNKTITASFNFDVPVRFNNDTLEHIYSGENYRKLEKITLVEVR